MRKTLIAMTAVSALVLGFSTVAYAASHIEIEHSFNGNNIGSSKFNIGGQNNGSRSISGVLNNQNVTGSGNIQNNNAPAIVLEF